MKKFIYIFILLTLLSCYSSKITVQATASTETTQNIEYTDENKEDTKNILQIIFAGITEVIMFIINTIVDVINKIINELK